MIALGLLPGAAEISFVFCFFSYIVIAAKKPEFRELGGRAFVVACVLQCLALTVVIAYLMYVIVGRWIAKSELPNKAPAGNGAVASRFHAELLRRAVPEVRRSGRSIIATMRLAVATFVALFILTGCQTQQARRPIDPEALGMHPKMEPTPDEAMKLQQDAIEAFVATLGQPLPTQFRLAGPTTGWFTDKGELRQVRASAKVPRGEFRARTASKDWLEIPIPREYLKAMHLPLDVPKDYMTCYVGQVRSKPAYLFWSDYAETTMLVLDY